MGFQRDEAARHVLIYPFRVGSYCQVNEEIAEILQITEII